MVRTLAGASSRRSQPLRNVLASYDASVSRGRQVWQANSIAFLPLIHGPPDPQDHTVDCRQILYSPQNIRGLRPPVSVEVSMRKIGGAAPKPANMKKDARLTIRIPRELKDRLDGIDRVYGVGLPKIANECLTAFCEYVEQKKQTPTFPILIISTHATMKGPIGTLRLLQISRSGAVARKVDWRKIGARSRSGNRARAR
jgi:hypothetical protein